MKLECATPLHKVGLVSLCLDQSECTDQTASFLHINCTQLCIDVYELRLRKNEACTAKTVLFFQAISYKRPLLIRLEEVQIEVIHSLAVEGMIPWMIDIPYHSEVQKDIDDIRSIFHTALIQVSFHAENSLTLPDTQSVFDLVDKIDTLLCDAIKVVSCPLTLFHALNLLYELRKRTINKKYRKPCTIIAMGEQFSFFRILAHFMGNYLTFTCLKGQKKAAGQVDIEELTSSYRLHRIKHLSALYGLLGGCVKNSIAQYTHTHLLHHLGQEESIYVKIECQKDDFDDDLVLLFKKLQFQGMSITTPLKKHVADVLHCDIPINTLTLSGYENVEEGMNTDVEAVYDIIQEYLSIADHLSIKYIFIIGAGDVAEAIAHFFIKAGWSIILCVRSVEKVRSRFSEIAVQAIISMDDVCAIARWARHAIVFINTVAYSCDDKDIIVIPPSISLSGKLFIEFSYPKKSMQMLYIEKNEKTCVTVSGLEVWMRQAAKQFMIWITQNALSSKKESEQEILNFFKQKIYESRCDDDQIARRSLSL